MYIRRLAALAETLAYDMEAAEISDLLSDKVSLTLHQCVEELLILEKLVDALSYLQEDNWLVHLDTTALQVYHQHPDKLQKVISATTVIGKTLHKIRNTK